MNPFRPRQIHAALATKETTCLTKYFLLWVVVSLLAATAWAAVVGSVRGVVHDPDHRPMPGAKVELKRRHRTIRKTWPRTPTEHSK